MPLTRRLSTGPLIAAIFVGQVLGMAGAMSFPALLPSFQRLWSLSGAQSGFVSGVYFAGYLVGVPVLSTLTDRVDPRRIYIGSLFLGAAAAAGFALLAHGVLSALLWRFLQGLGFGGTHMPGLRALSDVVPLSRQPRAVAVYTATFTVGASLSFAFSGALAAAFGWRAGFLLLALGPLCGAAPAACRIRLAAAAAHTLRQPPRLSLCRRLCAAQRREFADP
ncbi:MAG TPA: MFS transporter [Stellaceae bacterium]|nr:MFS transporter [Stellaceae bacterium]